LTRLGKFALAWLLGFTLTVAIGAGCSSCGHAATLSVRGTAPDQDNGGTCATPQLSPMLPANQLKIQLDITGPTAVRDSLTVTAGQLWSWARNVPAGTYLVRAWAVDAGGVGCDTTITIVTKNQPWKVRL